MEKDRYFGKVDWFKKKENISKQEKSLRKF